jgi:putative ABC transport system permease protein
MSKRWRILIARCRALAGRGRRERELDEEIADHLARLADTARAAGADAAAARTEALRRFGGVARTRERCREQLGFARLDALWVDLRLAARALARRPLLVAAAALSITVGAGLNLVVYAAVVRGLIGTTLSGAAPDERLLAVNGEISYPNYQDLARVDLFSGLAAMQVTRVAWRTGDGVLRLGAKVVTPNFFDVVGVRAAVGRTFTASGDEHAAVLGYAFWQRRFGGDRSAVGQTMTLNGWPYTVIGIAPPDFNAPLAPMVAADVYLPIGPQLALGLANRSAAQLDLIGRLKDGVSRAQARAAVAAAAADLERQYPRDNAHFAAALHIAPVGGLEFWRGLLGGAMPLALAAAATLFAIVGLVLLVACANVASLLLARVEERRREIAVCAALGATRGRLAQRVVAESALVAIAGCALAALVYVATAAAIARLAWNAGALTMMLPSLPLGCAAVVAIAVTIACAVAPALAVGRSPVAATVTSAAAHTPGRSRARRALVVVQVASCGVLLSGAAILFHDVARLRRADPGFDTAHTVAVEVRSAPNDDGVRLRPFLTVRDALLRLPGVESVSTARNLPLMFVSWRAPVRVDATGEAPRLVDIVPVGPRYFETLRIPLARGRDVADGDARPRAAATPVVVNQTFADRVFGAVDPLQRRLILESEGRGGPDRVLLVAGVARDSKTRSLDEDPHPVVYLPEIGAFMFVRMAGPVSASTARTIERAAWSADTLAWVDAQPMAAQVEFAQRPARFAGAALAALGAVGLAMAMIGLYAVVSYSVNRRTFEIGVRLALGARRGQVLRMIVGEGLTVVAIGCAIGIGAAQLAVRAIAPLVSLNHGRVDPLAFTAVVVAIGIVGAAASFAPARRASRVDPAVALRHE